MNARRVFYALVIAVCLAGFSYDAYTWARSNQKSFVEVLGHYWYVVVYVVASTAVAVIRYFRSPSKMNTRDITSLVNGAKAIREQYPQLWPILKSVARHSGEQVSDEDFDKLAELVLNSHSGIQCCALNHLATADRHYRRRAVPWYMKALRSHDHEVRGYAAQALLNQPAVAAIPVLEEALRRLHPLRSGGTRLARSLTSERMRCAHQRGSATD